MGGTAEEFYTAVGYHETDLDLCGTVSRDEENILVDLGFERAGRHRFHAASNVAVEFPEARIDGDESRVYRRRVKTGIAPIIGVDDLYLDRLRQATSRQEPDTIEYRSALAVAAAAFDRIDWRYVARRIRKTQQADPILGEAMKRVDNRIRRTVKKSFAGPR